MKKGILIIIAFIVLGLVFFLSEERQEEGLSEISYWKINPEEILYLPPKNISEFAKFISSELRFKKLETGLKTPPLFSVSGIDLESKENYTYEGSYNAKNLFTELSVLSIKSINSSTPALLEKFQISTESSPTLEIRRASKLEKKVYLGEETGDKSRRYLLAGNDVIAADSHIFQKFTNSLMEFRDRQYIHSGEFEIVRLQFLGDGIRLTIENNPETKNGIQNSKWFKVANGKFRVDPTNGANLFAYLQSFRTEIYPDEVGGEGFAVAKELISTESFAQLDIFLINGLHYKIKLFPKVVLKNKSYYPVLKEVEKLFIESPSYASEQSVGQMLDLLKKIQSAQEWTEAKGK